MTADTTAARFLEELRRRGLTGIDRCCVTSNRTVMVSFRRRELRVHRSFLRAPEPVLEAIVLFVTRRGALQRRARQVILHHPVDRSGTPARRERGHPADAGLVEELREWHERYNIRHFDGRLSRIPLRISRRMTARLGQYRISTCAGERSEIVIARRHIERHGWHEALDTLLHEMVHQWQHESGLPVDHGPAFRRKALEVGTAPSATRPARSPLQPRRADDIFWPSVA
ncbi:MAG TPA: SprT-like domain-containing protein [Gemmatimonadaceae bacterium]|nr:SprT-like domain-containing protein [Gemmatimonadaceae bacterium]